MNRNGGLTTSPAITNNFSSIHASLGQHLLSLLRVRRMSVLVYAADDRQVTERALTP
jgi:hypothetical protein